MKQTTACFLAFGLIVSFAGCGGGSGGNHADESIVDASGVESQEIDSLIRQADRALAGELDYQSLGLLLQENTDSLRESHPEKEAIINDLSMLGSQLHAGAGKAQAEQVKAKLQQLK